MVADLVLGLFDLVGAAGFAAATVMAFRVFRLTRAVSSYWLLYAIATFSGTVWALLLALEKFGVYAQLIDAVVGTVLAVTATVFALAAVLSWVSLIQPLD